MATAAMKSSMTMLSNVLSTSATVLRLDGLPAAIDNAPEEIIIFFHCLMIALLSKGKYPSALMSYIQGFLLSFGGGIACSIFLGAPTANVLFQSGKVVTLWSVAWWISNYNPIAATHEIFELEGFKVVGGICTQILRAKLIAAQIDGVVKAGYPGMIVVSLIAGSLAAAGGKLTADSLASISGMQVSSELMEPSYVLRSALFGSVIYLITTHLLGALTGMQGLGLILCLFIMQSVVTATLDDSFDWTKPLVTGFQTITLMKAHAFMATSIKEAPKRGRAKVTSSTTTKARSTSRGRTTSRTRKKKEL